MDLRLDGALFIRLGYMPQEAIQPLQITDDRKQDFGSRIHVPAPPLFPLGRGLTPLSLSR
jgi:hypothetical protein